MSIRYLVKNSQEDCERISSLHNELYTDIILEYHFVPDNCNSIQIKAYTYHGVAAMWYEVLDRIRALAGILGIRLRII